MENFLTWMLYLAIGGVIAELIDIAVPVAWKRWRDNCYRGDR